jgi:(1->4)-alpha-D-glucan 1-alpha-D-glucosylmutase
MVFEMRTAPAIPVATYRLQFNRDFTFSRAADLVPYLASLGITHCYASPYLRARPGSMHGYDIVDHHQLNPEIGSGEDYERFVNALHEHGMGQILDIVPNHMAILGKDNAWWLDVLENGRASAYAGYFDIDWEPLKDELQGKVLVPVLADQYGLVLDRGELKLTFDKERGEFSLFYFEHRFPIDPQEYPRILGRDIENLERELGAQDESFLELQSLISAFSRLPGREDIGPNQLAERLRDKEIHKRRLAVLCERSVPISRFIDRDIQNMNGSPGDSVSYDQLHELIKAQSYRLAFWRVAADDINYRRFFDINDLAALRQEDETVFNRTHEFILQLFCEGKIDGLRVDHPDGLYNPRQYFERLQSSRNSSPGEEAGGPYIVAEKILSGQEHLAPDWPIHGTTGYAFANLVNGVFVDSNGRTSMDRIYRLFTGQRKTFQETLDECKKLVMDQWLNSDLNVLASHLNRIALADRHTCDFTLKSLRDALTEIIACFPVYRTYVTEEGVSASDRAYINEAVSSAKSRSTAADSSVYDFIADVLLTNRTQGHQQFYQRSVIHFAMRFQQYTSALMAKGLEDTCFYRYNRLISLNDVGGTPLQFGVSVEEFHHQIQHRAKTWPHEMLATSTHDSKRSEDVRARINVLSEIPLEWFRQVRSWRQLNRSKKIFWDKMEDRTPEAPTPNDEYLFYQTLIGAWPLQASTEQPPSSFIERVRGYMLKAIREAKDYTSWNNQNQRYEAAVADFVDSVVQSTEFREVFVPFQQKVAHLGMLNSLAQTLIKLTVPGVPDIYQGNEFWKFDLVDPDNRRPVDYSVRQRALQQLVSDKDELGSAAVARELLQKPDDGRIKLYVMWKLLGLRNRNRELFRDGDYLPLETLGQHANHALAFARTGQAESIIVAVPRLCARLLKDELPLSPGSNVWEDTRIQYSFSSGKLFRSLFTGQSVRARKNGELFELPAGELFADFPIALLIAATD